MHFVATHMVGLCLLLGILTGILLGKKANHELGSGVHGNVLLGSFLAAELSVFFGLLAYWKGFLTPTIVNVLLAIVITGASIFFFGILTMMFLRFCERVSKRTVSQKRT
jgi:hypothetical protein